MDEEQKASELLRGLTGKERAALNLLLQHKSTKEIAQELGLACNTVDMRLRSARRKLGAVDRRDTARAYARLVAACRSSRFKADEVANFEPSPVAAASQYRDQAAFVLRDVGWIGHPVASEPRASPRRAVAFFAERHRGWSFVVSIVALAALICILAIAGVAIAGALARMECRSSPVAG